MVAGARIIDVHHHITPPERLADMRRRGVGERPTLEWTLEKSLAMMDRDGVATAMLSIPNIYQGERATLRRLARHCNEHGARIVANHPGRFGLFACLPLPDVEGALAEIDYAFDTLKADGVVLMTGYESKYLGDPAFAPVLDALERRKAVTFVHPLAPDCCKGILPLVTDATIEYEADTVRAIASVLYSGTARRCPGIRFIFSHGGGTLPSLIERFHMLPRLRPEAARTLPDGPEAALQRFHYDIAQSSHRVPLKALIALVSTACILFGTDFPYRTASEHSAGLNGIGLSAADVEAVERGNALRLLPRLG
ncbi:MAG: amidohydrolase family protein [Stellaceae bacterium]